MTKTISSFKQSHPYIQQTFWYLQSKSIINKLKERLQIACSLVTLQVSSSAVLQSCNLAVLKFCSHAGLPHKVLQCCSYTTLNSNNRLCSQFCIFNLFTQQTNYLLLFPVVAQLLIFFLYCYRKNSFYSVTLGYLANLTKAFFQSIFLECFRKQLYREKNSKEYESILLM